MATDKSDITRSDDIQVDSIRESAKGRKKRIRIKNN
jgi:hypothetical protein